MHYLAFQTKALLYALVLLLHFTPFHSEVAPPLERDLDLDLALALDLDRDLRWAPEPALTPAARDAVGDRCVADEPRRPAVVVL